MAVEAIRRIMRCGRDVEQKEMTAICERRETRTAAERCPGTSADELALASGEARKS
jgi:hypothetical protein